MSIRLNDQILRAMQIALEQNDEAVARHLKSALELSLTRMTGGAGFVERREIPAEIEQAFNDFAALEADQKRHFG